MNKGLSFDDVLAACVDVKLEVKPGSVALFKFEPQETTQGGIVLPDQAQEIPICGKILIDGSDAGAFPIGTIVYFRAYSDTNIPLGAYGEPPVVTVVSAKDILLVRRSDA